MCPIKGVRPAKGTRCSVPNYVSVMRVEYVRLRAIYKESLLNTFYTSKNAHHPRQPRPLKNSAA